MIKKENIQKKLKNIIPIWGFSPKGMTDPSLSIKISQIGGVGLVDFDGLDLDQCQILVNKMTSSLSSDYEWGIRISTPEILNALNFREVIPIIICAFSPNFEEIEIMQKNSKLLLSEVSYLEEAYENGEWSDLFLVKGNEAGGIVGRKNSFILIQEFQKAGLSFIIQGGFGIYNISTAFIGGAIGVVLESQLYLLPESPLSQDYKNYIKTIDESDFYLVQEPSIYNYRLIGKLANKSIRSIKEIEQRDFIKLDKEFNNDYQTLKNQFFKEITKILDNLQISPDTNPKHSLLPSDHGICFANYILTKFHNLENFLDNLIKIINKQIQNSIEHWPFAINSEFAKKLSILYPIIQGPMANISDKLEFANMVADNGALPILALGGLLSDETTELLSRSNKDFLSKNPYGCGIIGLDAVKARRDEHLRCISKFGPKITLIAAGTIDLGVQIKNSGNIILIHTPALAMFKEAIKKKLDYMILEGSECGGHFGQLSSLILWECILEYLDANEKNITEKVNIIFAGGIINEVSSAMVAGMIGNHLAFINPGIQMGTAYLLSEEIVSTKALLPKYQEVLLNNSSTHVIGTTVNTRARVIPTEFSHQTIQQELLRKAQGISISQRKELYEKENLGALRIASRAEIWNENYEEGINTSQFIPISTGDQLIKGAFMTGDSISFQKSIRTIPEIHYDIVEGGLKFIKKTSGQVLSLISKKKSMDLDKEEQKEMLNENKIAIIGLGGLFPDAENIQQYWENIINKRYSITEVPKDRWDPNIHYDKDHSSIDKTYTKIGGFVKNFEFKSIKYRIPPKIAERMDFVQKWAIITAEEALIDAGYPTDGKQRLPIAVIVGNSLGGDNQRLTTKRIHFNEIKYRINEASSQMILTQEEKEKLLNFLEKKIISQIPVINEDTMPGELSNIIAGRVANVFNLTGKNMTTDAACASSLAAVDTAVKGLLLKEYDMVLAGGVDSSVDPQTYIKFCKIGALSGDGSYPFDARANGFVIGEGAGFIVLKRLEDAIRDKNKIYAIISGCGASSDGKGKGITAPNPDGQKLAIERALENSNLNQSDLQYLECHGTSTVVGDVAELEVLNKVFFERDLDQKLAIGSVKSQIGHLKSAAGIAAIIKTVLALHNKIIPPSINVSTLNPAIDWSTSPFYVNIEPKEWPVPLSGVRRAGISSFGFGGTNYHIVLEEYLPQIYNLSNIQSSTNNYIKSPLDLSKNPHLSDICFLFSGQGSQYVGMGKELYDKFQVVKDTLNKANEICKDFGGFNLLEVIFGSPNLSQEENSNRLRQTEYTQPAIYSIEIALVRLFKTEGIFPGIVGGHSLGEFSALVTAGVLSFEDGLKIVINRGKAMSKLSPGVECSMAAIFTSPGIVEKILNKTSIRNVSISNYNSTSQTVISGELSAVEAVVKAFSEKEIRAMKLNVSNAFHSKYVAHAEEKLKNFLKSIEFKSPKIPVFSNVTGKIYSNDPSEIQSILLKQITSPVRWVDEIINIYQIGGRKFLEIGPKKTLFFFAKDILKNYKDIEIDFTLSPKSSEEEHLLKVFKKYRSPRSMKSAKENKIISPSVINQKQNIVKKDTTSSKMEDNLSSNEKILQIKNLPFFKEFLEEQKELLSSVIIQGFQNFLKKYQSSLENQFGKYEFIQKSSPVVITGVGIGLPGKNRNVFDDKNIDDILDGKNFIEMVSEEYKLDLLKKKIIRLEKSADGNAKFVSIDDISKVIHLAGELGEFNPTEDFQLDPKMLNALDITFQLAICAGYEALKDAGIPLVRSTIKTTTGKTLSGDWALPEALQDDTGVIFSSAFPGYDNFAEDCLFHSNRDQNQLNIPEDGTNTFNRSFLFRVLSMGHSQFAQLIKAKGPNTATNAACASTPQAISIAEDWIRNNRCKRVIVITADDVTSKNLFPWIGAGFIASGAATTQSKWEDAVLPFGKGRNGIILGAGTSAFVLEQQSEAENRGVKPIVEILGSFFSNSAYHGSRLDKDDISKKFNNFILKMEKIHGISRSDLAKEGMFISHETYSPARGGSAESEILALEKAFGEKAYDILIINTKGYTGHAMGAGIEEAVAIKSMEKGKIPPIANIEKIDPDFIKFNFSKGSRERKKYALRFAAGFGSQLAFVLFRLSSFDDRFTNPNYDKWLQNVGGNRELIFMDGRILKMNVERKSTRKKTLISPRTTEIPQKTTSIYSANILDEIKYIVAQKTGYDPSDIEENYDLEEDLGIDTVKQAEIFGEIREKWRIEVDDTFNIADYRTITSIVLMLNEYLGSNISSSKEIHRIESKTLETKLIQIIAEKTGYDIEDIDVDFDLEEDLGIDTVKQAEIFGELRNQLNISEDTEVNLIGLGTINNIIQKIQEYVIDQSIEPDANVVYDTIQSKNVNDEINQVKNLVKKIIADKTGYDIQDIDDDYDLEEDLGIDTVKQAEIFGELRTYYNLEDTIEINLADIRTPNAIIDFIMQLIGEELKLPELSIRTAKDVSKSKEKSEEVDSIGISQVVPTRVFKLVSSEKAPQFDNIKTLVININSGLSHYKNLIDEFKNMGMDIHVYNANGEKKSVKALKNKTTEVLSNKDFKIVILISPDNSQYSIDDSLNIFDILFLIFKSINLSIIDKILVISPENMFGWEQNANPLSSSISAFIKTINREFQIPIKIIASMNPRQIYQEFLGWDNLEEIAYKDDIRYTLLRKKIEDFPELNHLKITKDDVLLVTGGAQGITFACIDELTNHVKPELILLGLAPLDDSFYEYIYYSSDMLDEKKQEFVKSLKSRQDKVTPVIINKEWKKFLDKLDTCRNVENLKRKGLSVQYYAVDITNEEEMKIIFQKIKNKTKKPITIIVHGAGIEESKSFLKKNLNLAHKIVSVKIEGFSNIIKSIKLQDVKYFIAFASIAGRYGNQGQIDYAFANAYLSKLAWKFNQQKIQFLTFDWTAWGEIGMATRGSTLQILTQAGVTPIPSKTGSRIFSKLVLNNFTGEYIIAGNLGLFEEMLDVGEPVNKLEYPMIEKIKYQPDHIIGLNTINSKVDTYLLDHQIQQKLVFPGVMVLETFAELYYRVFNIPLNFISNINFHTPLKIPRGKSVDIEIIVNKSNNEINLFSKTFPPILKGKPLIKEHFSAQFDKSLVEMNWKKEQILEPIIPLLDKSQIYELFFHGKKFQVLKEIVQLEKKQIITKVDLPKEPLTNNIEGDKFQLNPLAIESVFQTAALFDFIINNHLSLPSKISSLKIISNQEPKFILTKFLKIDEERSYFNSAILNEKQEVIALIENLEIIHTQISVNLSNDLLDYLSTLLEYHKLKNSTQKQEIEVIPIAMIKKLLEKDPQFLEKYLTKREFENSERFRNLKRKIEYFSGIIAAKESYIKNSHINISYHDIEIQKDEKGKPFYYSLKNNQKIPLNLSITHSNEFSIVLISKNLIGIDLEKIESRSKAFYMEAFTESEREAILEDDLLGTIYWTAKEAFSKAIGKGTHINFRNIELKYNNNQQNFSVKLIKSLAKFNKNLEKLQLNVEFNEKYVLSYCEIKNFKENPIVA